jgi:hypothetical protein
MRLYVSCLECGGRDARPEVVGDAIAFVRRHLGPDPIPEMQTDEKGDFVIYDVCPECVRGYDERWGGDAP